MRPIITLLTDFGTADGYAGEIKGVILSGAPGTMVVDITHDIPPHDVEAGRLTLARVWRRFPRGTIHLAVIDPGVGSARAALAVGAEGRFLVGPDNGLLSPGLLVTDMHAVSLDVPIGAASTFHGRDVFAPAAAALAAGVALEKLGPPAVEPIVHRTPEPKRLGDGILRGEIISVDRFGNAVTNLTGARGGVVEVNGSFLPVQRTYTDVEAGALLAVVGSAGLIELAVRDGNAARELGLTRGSKVVLRISL